MLLSDVVEVSSDVGATPARLAKIARLAELLAQTPADEVATVVSWLSGELPQRQIGVGWAALRSLPAAVTTPSLSVSTVDALFSEIGATNGPGSQARRASLLGDLFGAATEPEQLFLRRLLAESCGRARCWG